MSALSWYRHHILISIQDVFLVIINPTLYLFSRLLALFLGHVVAQAQNADYLVLFLRLLTLTFDVHFNLNVFANLPDLRRILFVEDPDQFFRVVILRFFLFY